MFTQGIIDLYVPLLSSLIALLAICMALVTLLYSRKDRAESRKYLKEQEDATEASAKRKQQEEIYGALQGSKESVGFMALQLSRTPEMVSESNRESILIALCLSYIFDRSSRARALVLTALNVFSIKPFLCREKIVNILNDIKIHFDEYDELTKANELDKYHKRIDKLIDKYLIK